MKRLKLFSLLVLLMTAVTGAWAQGPWTSGDCTVTLSGGVLTISGSGAMADYASASDREWNTTSIKNSITSVVVGSGVTHIGNNSLRNLTNVTSVTLPEGLLTIGEQAFRQCQNAGFTSITIPASVTSIGADAFTSCNQLTSVTIADGSNLTTIGDYAFNSCKALGSINIPSSVTSIGNYAFSVCSALATVTIADDSNLTTIGNNAFGSCSVLGSITIPASVTSIGQKAFYGCTDLATITLNSNPSIGANAFTSTTAVTMNMTATPAGGANWMTFYNQNYSFEADANTEVFKVVLSGTALTMNKVANGIVDKNTAVVLKSTGNPVMTLTTSTSGDTQDNSLTGVSAAAGVTSDGTFYVLDNGASGLGFYKLASGNTVGVGNAYLTSDSESNFFSLEGEPAPEPDSETLETNKELSVYTGSHFSVTPDPGQEGDSNGFWVSYPEDRAVISTLNGETILSVELTVGYGEEYIPYFGASKGKVSHSGSLITISEVNATSVELLMTYISALQISQVKIYYEEKSEPTAIDQITNDKSQMTNKVIRNGMLLIERDGKLYNATGAEIR